MKLDEWLHVLGAYTQPVWKYEVNAPPVPMSTAERRVAKMRHQHERAGRKENRDG